MFLIDENVSELEVLKLRRARLHVRLIGEQVGDIGISDADLVRGLRRLKGPVVFSQDEDFFDYRLLHNDYGLVWLDVNPDRVAEYIRNFLRHPQFATQKRRLGLVARVSTSGIKFWRLGKREVQSADWP